MMVVVMIFVEAAGHASDHSEPSTTSTCAAGSDLVMLARVAAMSQLGKTAYTATNWLGP